MVAKPASMKKKEKKEKRKEKRKKKMRTPEQHNILNGKDMLEGV